MGQTKRSSRKRWIGHCSKGSGCLALKAAIAKYGIENFEIVEIYVAFSFEELIRAEKYFIKKFNTVSPNGYNLTLGGEGMSPSEETRQKISASNKGRRHTEEARKKMSIAKKGKPSINLGKKATEETRLKLSESHIGQIAWNRSPIGAYKNDILVKSYESITAAEKDGFFQQCIQNCLKGKHKQHKGYTWKRLHKDEVTLGA